MNAGALPFALWLFAAESSALATTMPGRAVTVGRCRPDPTAACWEEAVPLRRFASEASEFTAPLHADVRLGWDARGVLVRVAELTDGQAVEVTIGQDPDTLRLRRVLASSSYARVSAEVVSIPLAEPPTVGQVHAAWISLVDAAVGSGPSALIARDTLPVVRPWAPIGPGDLTSPLLLGLASKAGQPPVIRVDGAKVEAPGATLTAVAAEPALPSKARSHAWTSTDRDRLDLASAPEGEWIHLTARWQDGRVAAVWWSGTLAPVREALAADIFPAPQVIIAGQGDGLRLGDSTSLSVSEADWTGAAELLGRELRRLSGVETQLVAEGGVLRIVRARPGDLPREVRASLANPEGFALHVDGTGAVVYANDLLGATWGALALVDTLGTDAAAPALLAADHPAVARRVLHFPLTLGTGPLDPVRIEEWVERVVLRGRFNELVLVLQDGFGWTRRRGLARRGALDADTVRALDRASRRVGLTVSAALDPTDGARWITDARPDLEEDGKRGFICTRQPDTRSVLGDLVDEALDLLPNAPYLDLGHDRIGLATGAVWATQRCALCAGSPRALLFSEQVNFLADRVLQAKRGVILAADLLTLGGGRARAGLSALPADRLTVRAAPADVDKLDGYSVLESSDGYRQAWQAPTKRVVGRALRLGTANPWRLPASDGPASAPQPSHWTRVLLAGATAWRPDLAEHGLVALLATVRDAPAFLPGRDEPMRDITVGDSLPLVGAPPTSDRGWPQPREARAAGLAVGGSPVVAELGRPVRADVGRPVDGVSVLLSATLDHAAWMTVSRKLAWPGSTDGLPVATLVAVLADGTEQKRSLDLGTDLALLWGGPESAFPWFAAARWLGPDPTAEAAGAVTPDHALVRLDWPLRGRGASIREFRVEVDEPGVELLVAAIAPLERTDAR